jgi:hypothetical protein
VRRKSRPVLTGPAAELARYAAECQVAADRGDRGAAECLRAVWSWQEMLSLSGDDPDVGALFVAFAEDARMMAGSQQGAP